MLPFWLLVVLPLGAVMLPTLASTGWWRLQDDRYLRAWTFAGVVVGGGAGLLALLAIAAFGTIVSGDRMVRTWVAPALVGVVAIEGFAWWLAGRRMLIAMWLAWSPLLALSVAPLTLLAVRALR